MFRIAGLATALAALGVAAAPAPAPAGTVDRCTTVVDGRDIGLRVCAAEPGCYVSVHYTDKTGTDDYCLRRFP